MSQTPRQKTGRQAELTAKNYLVAQGLQYIDANYRCKRGEIDLIMRDQTHLVFVEVRFRRDMDYGGSLASINTPKQKRIIRAAEYYLVSQQLQDKEFCRFDVVGIDQQGLKWIKDAFQKSA
ncbi:MAG: YraN family protein [Gammaproteobacteria bacterium]|nr:YraN family protein [Gammaproteobacteria bacterium]